MAYANQVLDLVVLTLSLVGLAANLLSVLYKIAQEFSIPKLWKYSLITIDVGHLFLGVGLMLFYVFQKTNAEKVCTVTAFFIQFGIFDCVCGYLTSGIILLGIYNPGKSSQISSFHRNVFLVVVIPQKVISLLLSILPLVPIEFFTSLSSSTVKCYKVSRPGDTGDKFGILTFFIIWITLTLATITFVISAIKNWKGFNNRIHAASPNVWQAQLVQNGKSLLKLLLTEDVLWFVTLIVVTTAVYNGAENDESATWTVYITLSLVTVFHWVISVIQCTMWTYCCCRSSTAIEETHRKLKRLDLIKIEAPGKIRLRALWNVSKGTVKRGLMKVYGPRHVKAWAQEIVVLGMLRKAQHPSLLQCLWTSSSNPYYETMTLITGEVITSDSRIICLELTNNGTLQDFLYRLDTPLPETCQRMIVHDVAEGLMCLHDQNILHGSLSTACVYLKGSLPSMVMRAAIGDFEDSQMYGSLHQTGDTVQLGDKRRFFLSDIRSFALVALEVVSKMCEKRFLGMQYEWNEITEKEQETYSAAANRGAGYNPANQGPSYNPANQSAGYNPANQGGDYMEVYHSDSDGEDDMLYCRRRRSPGVLSPGEVIEEIGRRSRSMSPRSRPQSAQSTKSRSRTLSPDTNRGKFLNSVQTNYPSRLGTPDSCVISPEDEYPCFSKDTTDVQRISNERPFSPERPSSGRKSPTRPRTPSKKSKNKDQAFETFAGEGKKSKPKGLKKIDSKKWLSKPGTLIRTLTGAETSVSVFKAKETRDDDVEEIDDEEIDYGRLRMKHALMARNDSSNSITFEKDRYLHRTSSKQSDQWSILSDMEYNTSHGLRKTVSTDSRSSMWSNLPLPVEMIDVEGSGERDRFDNMIGQLPGMADTHDYPSVPNRASDMWNPKFNGAYKPGAYWRYDGPGPSQFELVDYYDELQGKYVKKLQLRGSVHRTLSGSQIVGLPVHRTYSGTLLLHKTSSGLQEILEQAESMEEEEPSQSTTTRQNQSSATHLNHSSTMHQNQSFTTHANQSSTMHNRTNQLLGKDPNHSSMNHPNQSSVNKTQPVKKLKAKLLKNEKFVDPPQPQGKLTIQNKAQKSKEMTITNQPSVKPEPKIDPVISANKRARARKALKGALGKSTAPVVFPLRRDSKRGQKREMEVKYANVKKLQTQISHGESNMAVDMDMESAPLDVSPECVCYPDPSPGLLSVPAQGERPQTLAERPQTPGICKYHSFSSNDSTSSLGSSIRLKKADVSLTSGELTSLSSQADHEIDEQMGRDPDLPSKEVLLHRTMLNKAKVVDSGFDSEGSEVSMDVRAGHHQHFNYLSSDDSAYPDHRDRQLPRKPFRKTPVHTSEWQMSEKAFVVTGINTDRNLMDTVAMDTIVRDSAPKDYVVIDTVVEDNNFPYDVCDEEALEDNLMNSQGKSRIIQVSAAPLTVMSIDQKAFQDQIHDNAPVTPPPARKQIEVRPRTPMSVENRPPTPGRLELQSKSLIMIDDGQVTVDPLGYTQSDLPILVQDRPPTPGRSGYNRPKTPQTVGRPATPGRGGNNRHKTSVSGSTDGDETKQRVQYASPLVASKRYRELTMKGVPLRVSVISADGEGESGDGAEKESDKSAETSEFVDNQTDDQKLFDNLESNGFFHGPPKKVNDRPLSGGIFPTSHRSRREQHLKKGRGRQRPKHLALDEIIREMPEDKSPSPRLLSPTANVLSKDSFNSHSGSEAMLNQPASSIDESESVHLPHSPSHPISPTISQPSVVVDSELYIDRIYSHGADLKPRPVHVRDPAFDLPITPENYLPENHESYRDSRSDGEEEMDDREVELMLLSGVDDKHVISCHKLTSDMHLLSFNDLLPARKESFNILKTKLYQGGQLGSIGFQLLEVIDKCWLNELPPSSSDLVAQLLDPVTETEL